MKSSTLPTESLVEQPAKASDLDSGSPSTRIYPLKGKRASLGPIVSTYFRWRGQQGGESEPSTGIQSTPQARVLRLQNPWLACQRASQDRSLSIDHKIQCRGRTTGAPKTSTEPLRLSYPSLSFESFLRLNPKKPNTVKNKVSPDEAACLSAD